jgi:hypothetical protein
MTFIVIWVWLSCQLAVSVTPDTNFLRISVFGVDGINQRQAVLTDNQLCLSVMPSLFAGLFLVMMHKKETAIFKKV